jgi:predicted DNA-binding antitoxin AbrB/MazE fold protein
MVAINAHFDGHVFVPDEPVQLRPGERVVVQHLGVTTTSAASDGSFVRKLDIELDARALRDITDDPELNLENF